MPQKPVTILIAFYQFDFLFQIFCGNHPVGQKKLYWKTIFMFTLLPQLIPWSTLTLFLAPFQQNQALILMLQLPGLYKWIPLTNHFSIFFWQKSKKMDNFNDWKRSIYPKLDWYLAMKVTSNQLNFKLFLLLLFYLALHTVPDSLYSFRFIFSRNSVFYNKNSWNCWVYS